MHKHEKNFAEWNELKAILDKVDYLLHFNEREIWWLSFGINIGVEIDGKGEMFERPAIIIKKYNKHHLWVIPLSSADFNIKPEIHVPIYHESLPEKYSVAVISQLQSQSSKRLTSYIGTLSISQFRKVIDAVKKTLPEYTKDLEIPGLLS